MEKKDFDVIIIGGGPAGLSAAISLLQKKQCAVLVVEGQTMRKERIGESCPPDIILLLKQLGLSNVFNRSKHEPCPGYASVWGKNTVGYNDFIVNPMGPSWRLDRISFDQMLAEKAKSLGAKISWKTHFLGTDKNDDGYKIRCRNVDTNKECTINARFVVDASGANARFAKSLGISKDVEDLLFAVVRTATVLSGKKLPKQVQIEATQHGWWYNTILPNNRLVTMMVTEKENLAELRKNQYQTFVGRATSTSYIGTGLKNLTLTDKAYYTKPIYSGALPIVEGNDWIAIGDAAASYDPIAAHGIYKGINDGIFVANQIISCLAQKEGTTDKPFTDMVMDRYKVYKRNRAYLYMMEQRWADARFWKNRSISHHRKTT